MEKRAITMEDVMTASLGETSSSIRATFKRTINIKQYETETVELSTTLEVGKDLTGIERMLMSGILQAQLEYQAYIQMGCKGFITNSELAERKRALMEDLELLRTKGELLTGKSLDYLFDVALK